MRFFFNKLAAAAYVVAAVFLFSQTPVLALQGRQDVVIPSEEILDLKHTLQQTGGDVFIPANAEFHNATVPFDVSCTERPKAVIIPATEGGLQEAVRLLVKHDVEFVVSTNRLNQNCLSTTTGYLINMRRFNVFDFDAANMEIRLGAGNLGDEVNQRMQGLGAYYVPGLICTWGSVVGPIFGGGFSWHLNWAFPGTMADNALAFRFMDYLGEMHVVNAAENEDLFWALRGGGGQLGIVTEVTMRVFERTEPFTLANYEIDCTGCSADKLTAILHRIGNMNNEMPSDLGMFHLLMNDTFKFSFICNSNDPDCDPEGLIGQYFPEATLDPEFAPFVGTGKSMQEIYTYIRFDGMIIGGLSGIHDPTEPLRYEDSIAAYPVIPLTLGSWLVEQHEPAMTDALREVLDASEHETTAIWTMYMGGAVDRQTDSAESTHRPATMVWSVASFAGDENVLRVFDNGMSRADFALGTYWNYKHRYTSEEWTFTSNLDRIREIRSKWDPNGVFTLPARRNEGSKLTELCFARYDCSNHGKLVPGSTKATGCPCICDQGWTGERCQEQDATDL